MTTNGNRPSADRKSADRMSSRLPSSRGDGYRRVDQRGGSGLLCGPVRAGAGEFWSVRRSAWRTRIVPAAGDARESVPHRHGVAGPCQRLSSTMGKMLDRISKYMAKEAVTARRSRAADRDHDHRDYHHYVRPAAVCAYPLHRSVQTAVPRLPAPDPLLLGLSGSIKNYWWAYLLVILGLDGGAGFCSRAGRRVVVTSSSTRRSSAGCPASCTSPGPCAPWAR